MTRRLALSTLCAIGALVMSGAACAQLNPEPLLRAIANDDVAGAKAAISRGIDPNSVDGNGEPVLVAVAREGHEPMARALLEMKAQPNVRNRFGDTPIMVAALKGHLGVVKALHAGGADINHPGWTPLIYAATGGHSSVVEFLLRSGAFMDTVAPNGVSPLMMAVRGRHLDTVKLLIEHGADVSHRAESGATPLQWAIERNLTDIERLLRAAGARS